MLNRAITQQLEIPSQGRQGMRVIFSTVLIIVTDYLASDTGSQGITSHVTDLIYWHISVSLLGRYIQLFLGNYGDHIP